MPMFTASESAAMVSEDIRTVVSRIRLPRSCQITGSSVTTLLILLRMRVAKEASISEG